MNLNESNEPAAVATVPAAPLDDATARQMLLDRFNEPTAEQLLARQEARIIALILMRSQQRLPYPRWGISSSGSVSLHFGPLADLNTWSAALVAAGAVTDLKPRRSTNPAETYLYQILKFQDADIFLRAHEPPPSDATPPLDADTVASLEEVAAEPVKDQDRVDVETTPLGLGDVGGYPVGRAAGQVRVSDERVQEILDGLNGLVDRAHDGTDFNLVEALAWAKAERDVEATGGPVLGHANVQLVDGTLIEWEPDRAQWAVTVSDGTESEVLA